MNPGPMNAGDILLTLMLKGERSFEAITVICLTAALLVAYAIMLGGAPIPAIDAVLTIAPP